MRALAEIFQSLPTNADTGLSPEGVAASRQRYGGNHLTPLPREPLWKKFIEKFDEPIIQILLAAALLSMFVDLFQASPVTAGVALVLVGGALGALYFTKRSQWIPTGMFVSAIVLFFVGLI